MCIGTRMKVKRDRDHWYTFSRERVFTRFPHVHESGTIINFQFYGQFHCKKT